MKLELQTKLEPKDLLKAMEFLGKSLSSGENIHTYSKSPIHILVHNEILKFSKEEIDSCKEELKWHKDLYSLCFIIKNPYIFSAFMKIGAFEDKISKDTQWLLKQEKNPSNDLYELMYYVEDTHHDKRNNHEEYNGGILFNCLFEQYAYNLDTEKLKVIDSYFKTFGKRKEKVFLEFICQNYGRRTELCDYLVMKLKHNNVDLSKNGFMNKSLPEEKHWSNSKQFFISSQEMPRIQKLLEAGFRFDEKNYSHYGDDLFTALVKSGETRLVKPILPYLSLKDVVLKSGSLMEQDQFIESLNKLGDKPYDTETLKFIKTLYDKCVLELELTPNNISNKKKLKV